jgi:hypothetical protein
MSRNWHNSKKFGYWMMIFGIHQYPTPIPHSPTQPGMHDGAFHGTHLPDRKQDWDHYLLNEMCMTILFQLQFWFLMDAVAAAATLAAFSAAV